MKRLTITAEVSDIWEPNDCDNCPFSYLDEHRYEEDDRAYVCVIKSDGCPAKESVCRFSQGPPEISGGKF